MSIKEKKRKRKRKNKRTLQYWLPELEGKRLKLKKKTLGSGKK